MFYRPCSYAWHSSMIHAYMQVYNWAWTQAWVMLPMRETFMSIVTIFTRKWLPSCSLFTTCKCKHSRVPLFKSHFMNLKTIVFEFMKTTMKQLHLFCFQAPWSSLPLFKSLRISSNNLRICCLCENIVIYHAFYELYT